jgi:hypothetical protein
MTAAADPGAGEGPAGGPPPGAGEGPAGGPPPGAGEAPPGVPTQPAQGKNRTGLIVGIVLAILAVLGGGAAILANLH